MYEKLLEGVGSQSSTQPVGHHVQKHYRRSCRTSESCEVAINDRFVNLQPFPWQGSREKEKGKFHLLDLLGQTVAKRKVGNKR